MQKKINVDELFFQENGYLIKKIKDTKSLNYIFKKFEKIMFQEKKMRNKIIQLNKLHNKINKASLNNMRVSLIKKINEDKKFSLNYYNIAKDTLDFLIGNEVAMQKNINVSIQTPRDKNSMLSMHSDIHAGESPFEVVAWLPLTDVESNSMSMFITKPKFNKIINKSVVHSKKNIHEIYKKNKKKFKFIEIKFGEILIFSPILLHGNTVNETDKTRISMNCRFKSLLTPYNVFSKTHRNIPHFYKPLTIKPMTKIGFNFIRKINETK
jgi:sporadic carbohydrate cluster 2OG-Fe(II) oxygenase